MFRSWIGLIRSNWQDIFPNHGFHIFRNISAKQKIAARVNSDRKVDPVKVFSFLFSDSYVGSN